MVRRWTNVALVIAFLLGGIVGLVLKEAPSALNQMSKRSTVTTPSVVAQNNAQTSTPAALPTITATPITLEDVRATKEAQAAEEAARSQQAANASHMAQATASASCSRPNEYLSPTSPKGLSSQPVTITLPTMYEDRSVQSNEDTFLPIGAVIVLRQGILAVYSAHCGPALQARVQQEHGKSLEQLVQLHLIEVISLPPTATPTPTR